MMSTVSRLFKAIYGYLCGVSFSTFILFTCGVFIVFINPSLQLFTPRCIFREITGFYCAGCGMTTGFYSLLKGDFTGAFERNLLIVTLFPLALFYITMRRIIFYYIGKYKYSYDKVIIILFILSVVIFTICRNISSPEFDILRPH